MSRLMIRSPPEARMLPPLIATSELLPKALSLPISSKPAVIRTAPVSGGAVVLFPDNSKVPAPDLVSGTPPPMVAETIKSGARFGVAVSPMLNVCVATPPAPEKS
jgi:hypothetical protein